MEKPYTNNTRSKVGISEANLPKTQNGEPYPVKELDLRDLVFFRDFHRMISRYWKPHLSAAEYSVLDMIVDRTLGWGKLWELISLSHFVRGVWSDEITYSDGTGLGKRTIQRAIITLLKKGVI